MTRPRAADDFKAIRARMEELRGERVQASADADESHSVTGSRPYAVSRRSLANSIVFPPAIIPRAQSGSGRG
jgi:hypothetical protein